MKTNAATLAPRCPDCGKANHVARWGVAHGYRDAGFSCLRCVVESARNALLDAIIADDFKGEGYWSEGRGK